MSANLQTGNSEYASLVERALNEVRVALMRSSVVNGVGNEVLQGANEGSVVVGGDSCAGAVGVVRENKDDDCMVEGSEERELRAGVLDSRSETWSDVVGSDSELQMPGDRPSVGSAVRQVKFGGVADVDEAEISQPGQKFYAQFVRVPRVFELVKALQNACGAKLPRKATEEIALASYTIPTIPNSFLNGARRLRGLMAVGDAAMTFALMNIMYSRAQDVSSAQFVRGDVLTNAMMSRAFVDAGWDRYVSSVGGVNLATAKVGADCLEALMGVVSRWRGIDAVVAMMYYFGLLT